MIRLRQLCSVSLGLCQSNVTHTVDVPCGDESYCCGSPFRKDISGGYCGGVPPLPIPNREVKPTYADGTAMQCGRVGSRLLFEKSEALRVAIFSGLLLFVMPAHVIPRLRHPRSHSLGMQGSVILAVYLWSYPNMVIGNAQIVDIIFSEVLLRISSVSSMPRYTYSWL